MQQYYGGSFAPPIDEAKLAAYTVLANSAEPRVRDEMLALIAMVKAWWDLPESTGEAKPHTATPRASVIPLDPSIIAELDRHVPYTDELQLLSNGAATGVFDSLTGDLRNAAFHLLWFGHELSIDREPITSDKLAQ